MVVTRQQPNIVFIITDDQGYGDLGCTGNPMIQTPHIDQLYQESVRFTDFHVGPTCAPTRAGLMTGHYHNSTGVWHTIGGRSLMRKDEVSLADVFRANGYKTGIFGKWHLGDNYPYRPHDRGFDEAIVHGGGGISQTPDYWGNDYFDDHYYDRGVPRPFKGYCTDVFFQLGLDFIDRHRDQPFFCYIPTNAPHSPLNVEEHYVDMYRGQVPENRARFYGMITNIDENVGKLRAALHAWGLADNTIVIFMTDNGTADGSQLDKEGFLVNGYNAGMRGKKGSRYDGGHRVPFFLHWPAGGYSTGEDVQELTANVDFMPTLIDLCGLQTPRSLPFDGKSLLPIMQGETAYWEERALVTDSQRVTQPIKWKDSAVMLGKWRLVNGKELFNIQHDPEQRIDVSAQHPELVEQMRQDYEVWWEKVSVQFDNEIPISIGTLNEPTTRITAHDWHGDAPDVVWNQGDIRAGKITNSYVELLVETSGTYTFELRRWPEEEGAGLTSGLPDVELPNRLTSHQWYSGGRAIQIKRATIEIAHHRVSQEVTAQDDVAITFTLPLLQGPAHLQTYFEDVDGHVLGAYYVYVRKI